MAEIEAARQTNRVSYCLLVVVLVSVTLRFDHHPASYTNFLNGNAVSRAGVHLGREEGSIRGIKGLPPAFKDLRIDREIKFRWRDFNGEFCVKNCSLRQRRVRYFEGEIRNYSSNISLL